MCVEPVCQVGSGRAIDKGEVLFHLAKEPVLENDCEHFLKIAIEKIAELNKGALPVTDFVPGNSGIGRDGRHSGYLCQTYFWN